MTAEARLRHRALWLGIGLGLVALVIFLSLAPKPLEAPNVAGVKVGHFIAYGTLMLWFAQIYRSWPARLALAAGFALMGVGLEYAQGLTTYRTFAYSDMMDNAFGVAVGLALGTTPLGAALARVERWMAA